MSSRQKNGFADRLWNYLLVRDARVPSEEDREASEITQKALKSDLEKLFRPFGLFSVLCATVAYLFTPAPQKEAFTLVILSTSLLCLVAELKRRTGHKRWHLPLRLIPSVYLVGYAITILISFHLKVQKPVDIQIFSTMFLSISLIGILIGSQHSFFALALGIFNIAVGVFTWSYAPGDQNVQFLILLSFATVLAVFVFYTISHGIHEGSINSIRARRLELRVKARNRDIRALFTNIEQGILTFLVDDGRVENEYSGFLETILETKQIAGERIEDLLWRRCKCDEYKIEKYQNILSEQNPNLAQQLELLPRDIFMPLDDGEGKHLELEWYLLGDMGRARQVLVTIRDVTALTRLKLREEQESRSLQEALLSRDQKLAGLSVASYYQAAEDVGGDWFGYRFDATRNRLFLFMGDVTGHGSPAALVTGAVSGAIRLKFMETNSFHEDSRECLKEIARDLNFLVLQSGALARHFMTMAIVAIDLTEGICHYLNAGHPFIMHSQADRVRVRPLRGDPLGFREDARFDTQSFPIDYGDVLVLYTDGLFEGVDKGAGALNIRELSAMVKGKSPNEIVSELRSCVETKWAERSPADDCACLAVRLGNHVA